MAFTVPQPRSYQQILADQVLTFKARFGIRQLKTGSSILTALEAAAQSDLRSTQDVFNALDLRDVTRLSGQALEFEARSEGLTKNPALPASGKVDISDTTLQRISTSVYSGSVAPVAGSSTLRVVSAVEFPATGQIYIGRGTINVEGPISYSAKTQFSGFWTLTLTTPTATFHNINEDVVLAQKGSRPIPAGTTVATTRDARTQPIQYSTTSDAEILDGEVSVSNVPIICQEPGSKGNVPRGSITSFTSLPFAGAACTNPQPLTSGSDIESDDQLVQRLVLVKSSKSRGTSYAILSAASGVFSPDENKRVSSVTIVEPADEPATVYIDDGTGYEELNEGIPYEVLVDNASGGEQYFALSGQRPVSRAFTKTTLTGPFSLVSGAKLSVVVGGILTEHSFSPDEFTAIGSALAVEVVSSINSNPDILFSARTSDNGTKVSLLARSDTNDDIQVSVPSSGIDANVYLGFSTDTSYTLKLYKNDQLLYKDGQIAAIDSAAQSSWATIATGYEIKAAVDGTPAATYTFTDADFVASNTGYTTVSKNNSIASWAQVFNDKIPGITASDGGGYLILQSNKGADSGASIVLSAPVSSPNLITAGMFTPTSGLSASGLNRDYSLNRNTAQVKLFEPLVAGDSLTVGSINTRGAAQSADLSSGSVTFPSIAKLWVAVDGATEILDIGVSGSTTYTFTHSTGAVAATLPANGALVAGDYAVVWDTAVTVHGAFRVTEPSTITGFALRYAMVSAAAQAGVSLLNSGMVFARTNSYIQEVRIPAGVQTLDAIVTCLNEQLTGATASIYRGRYLRISSNNYRGGDIMVVTADQSAQLLGFDTGVLNQSSVPHLASLLAGPSEVTLPSFGNIGSILTNTTNQAFPQFTTDLVFSTPVRAEAGRFLYGLPSYQRAALLLGNTSHLAGRHKLLAGRQNVLSIANFTSRAKQTSSAVTQFTVAAGGLVRAANIVTVTTPTAHGFKTGDVIFSGPIGTADANFLADYYAVASTPTNTTLTYASSGSAVASAQSYGINLWDDAQENDGGDLFCLAQPYAVGPYDSLSVVMNDDSLTQTYNIPMYRNVTLTGSTGAAMNVFDTDNGGAALDDSFGVTPFFNDFWCYMKPKVISHLGEAFKEILWRYNRYGSEGNDWSVAYTYPESANQTMAYEIANGSDLQITLPSGAARAGLNILANTAFTSSNVASGNGRSVTMSYYTATPNISTIGRAGSVVSVVTGSTHGLAVGQVVYISGVSGVDFPPGPKIVTTAGATTFTYTESGTAAAPAALGGLAASSLSPPSFAAAVAGDIISIASPNPAWTLNGTYRITTVNPTSIVFFVPAASVTNLPAPTMVGSATAISIYPIDTANSTADDVVAFVTSDLADLFTAEAYLNPGSGILDRSTLDEDFTPTVNYAGTSVDKFSLKDGVNYVRTSDLTVVPNTIRFKQGTDGGLSTFTSEPARLVPVTSETISAWLNSPAVTGLGQVADLETTGLDGKLQITSENPGELGGVQMASNSLNGQIVPVTGAGDVSLKKVNFSRAFDYSLLGGSYVALQNTDQTVSSVPNATGVSTITLASNGTVTLSTQTNTSTSFVGGGQLIVHKVGDFALYLHKSATTFGPEGDFIFTDYENASSSNNGYFRIVRSGTITSTGTNFQYAWVENPNAVNEVITPGTDTGRNYTANSLLPGDLFEIAYELGTDSNIGIYEVQTITPNSGVFTVDTTFTAVSPVALGTDLNQIRMIKSPLRLIKFLSRIGIDPDSSIDPLVVGTSWAIFDSGVLLSGISETLGGNIQPLSRFDFATTPLIGANGYNVSTGLIGEVTKVLYGDLSAPTIYPGVVAAGASVNISGPNVKRIQVSLQLRLRTGATQQATIDRVRNAVATAVNSIPLGTAVDISRIVSAARAVSGVAAVSVLSPTYSSESDLIPVQANEKPFIFDPDVDVQISIAV